MISTSAVVGREALRPGHIGLLKPQNFVINLGHNGASSFHDFLGYDFIDSIEDLQVPFL
jgi:hypothetical protein